MSSRDPFIGRELLDGQFRIQKKIGTGGMGAVYLASQITMNRSVAIKILHPKLAARKDLTSRFRREARAMSQLTHPNTAKVFTYGELEDDGSLYIVMELLEGQNLNQAVRKGGPLSLERAIPIMVQVCGALQEAHSLGIVHRDLKPENIFLCNQGGLTDFPKVLDFGLAKVTEQQMRPGSVILTQEGMVFGTPEFMSPEQAQGKTLDPRSDIYSLAVILYEMLTGRLPFSAGNPMEYIQKHVLEPIIPLNERVPDKHFPPGLGQVLTSAMAKKPEQRYQSAAEFAEALRPFGEANAASAVALLPSTPAPLPVAGLAGHEAPESALQGQAMALASPSRLRAAAPAAASPLGLGVLLSIAVGCLLTGAGLALLILRWFSH